MKLQEVKDKYLNEIIEGHKVEERLTKAFIKCMNPNKCATLLKLLEYNHLMMLSGKEILKDLSLIDNV